MDDLLTIHGAQPAPASSVQHALERAGADHRPALARHGTVLPGVHRIITALADVDDAVQTVVTGNVRANAEVKLGALGLLRWLDLDVGGYGSDDRRRSRLVELAMTRAAAKYGSEYGRTRTVIIGDTPRDVQAGSDNGVRVLAVATGIHSADELRDAGASFVVPSLIDASAALRFVLAPDTDEHAGTP
jgi:phosphoglycolate phosphatase-like HAD superfamily hydrolase